MLCSAQREVGIPLGPQPQGTLSPEPWAEDQSQALPPHVHVEATASLIGLTRPGSQNFGAVRTHQIYMSSKSARFTFE